MTKWRKVSIPAAAVAAVALVLPLSATPAAAQAVTEHHREIPFGAIHPCTKETVEGPTDLHVTTIMQENGDGTTTVKVRQHAHAEQMIGDASLDFYTFNENQQTDTEVTILSSGGSTDIWTRWIHTSEDVAFQEEPGLDDYFQKTTIFFSSLLPPTFVEDERPDCR
ncbi:MAG TPA: hypothetical protein VHI71_06730 [Actinomycetota bacterium]|nr:hypothetical protein [Actinomycetota bacterium]